MKNFSGSLEDVIPPIYIGEDDQFVHEMYLVSTIPINCLPIFTSCAVKIQVKSKEGQAINTCVFR